MYKGVVKMETEGIQSMLNEELSLLYQTRDMYKRHERTYESLNETSQPSSIRKMLKHLYWRTCIVEKALGMRSHEDMPRE